MKKCCILLLLGLVTVLNSFAWDGAIPKVPIGMNISSPNYYDPGLVFTDVMKSSDFRSGWDDYWNTSPAVPKDVNGYPLEIPYTGQAGNTVRFMINNFYVGRYVVLYDGVGSLSVNGVSSQVTGGKLYINFTGQGGNVWIDIQSSQLGNHVRNIRILPDIYASGGAYPTFRKDFLDGLRPFHALRMMDWLRTNGCPNQVWANRTTKTFATQAVNSGISLEYCVEICNELNVDGWFCVPHQASDDYTHQMAKFLKDNMNPNLKIYIEYSNEIWNWMFDQSGWVLDNAPQNVGETYEIEQYVQDSLALQGVAGINHPEKDAFMISRMFKLFYDEFTTPQERARLVKVAAVQHGWTDNTGRILSFLQNKGYKIMPDLVSPGGYFNFQESDHNTWNAMNPNDVTPEMILDAVEIAYPQYESVWTDQTAEFANQFGVGYAIYEGGQHMQPYLQGDYAYNPAVYASQIHPQMFDMYMTNFAKVRTPSVNCQLFIAFNYIGERESRWGSWGHLERFSQLHTDSILNDVPKYNALLYANTQKADSIASVHMTGSAAPSNQVDVTLTCPTSGTTIYYSLDGKYPFTLKYTAPFRVALNTPVYAIASKVGYTHSKVSNKLAVATSLIGHKADGPLRFSIYPNPAKDNFTISSISNDFTNASLSISDLSGKLIIHEEMMSKDLIVSISNLAKGVYVVEIVADGLKERQKLVVK